MQVVFQNITQQLNFFNNYRIGGAVGSLYYKHSTGRLKVSTDAVSMITLATSSYLSFINPSHEDRYYFCRITDIEAASNKMSYVNFEVDWFQTDMHDFTARDCAIEREHMDQGQAVAAAGNPWMGGTIELETMEANLPVSRDMEDIFKHPSNISSSGIVVGSGPIDPGGVAGAVSMWPNFPLSSPTGIFNDYSAVMMISPFSMTGDPYGSRSGPRFSDFIKWCSWVSPTMSEQPGGNTAIYDPIPNSRPYVMAFRGDRGGHTYKSRYERLTMSVAKNMQEAINETMNFLASQNLTHMVVGGPWLIPNEMLLTDAVAMGAPGMGVAKIPVPNSAYNNLGIAKLSRSPYRYVRVVSPLGEEVAFSRELFKTPANPQLLSYMTLDDVPTSSMSPMEYDGHDVDLHKRLSFGGFPVSGYATDNFLSYVGQMQNEAALNTSTQSSQKALKADSYANRASAPTLSDVMGAAVKSNNPMANLPEMLGGAMLGLPRRGSGSFQTGAEKNAASLTASDMAADATVMAMKEQKTLSNLAQGGWTGDSPHPVLESASRAIVSKDWHAGSLGAGLMSYFRRMAFTIYDVSLKPEYKNVYAQYFRNYGYSSGRFGVPRIVSLMRGGVGPEFHTINGLASTYCKTSGIKISGGYAPSNAAIQATFDNGCRFIKGW